MKKIFIAGAIPEAGLKQLEQHFDVDMYTGETLISEELLIEKIKDVDALITLLSTNVSRKVIETAPKLKIIANYGAGFNNIDIEAAREHDINVTNTPIASTYYFHKYNRSSCVKGVLYAPLTFLAEIKHSV
ncbi:hypothetical protein BUY28_00310 [Staphylococcus cohnii]|nr:putative 2-hydroxyacid dehydrogenase [Staphylococcus cohnii subsp. barensis]PTF06394.1 hypothetical protein BUY36_06135 [Staphylococcus cohnii]PTG68899.1 hypothetical protein BUY28_00310 [Staphylococcus cohnii]